MIAAVRRAGYDAQIGKPMSLELQVELIPKVVAQRRRTRTEMLRFTEKVYANVS